jgi:hypothetical protein
VLKSQTLCKEIEYNEKVEYSRFELQAFVVEAFVVEAFLFVTYVPKSPSTAKVSSLLSPGAGIVSNCNIPG